MTDTNETDAPRLLTEDGTPLPYGDAVAELEDLLGELESSTVDVDHLTEQVARAKVLIHYCQARLSAVRADVDDVLADLGGEDTTNG